MDETQLFHQVLWKRYFKAEKDLANFKRLVEEYGKKVDDAFSRANTFRRALQAEGLEPSNPPAEFMPSPPADNGQPATAEHTEATSVIYTFDEEEAQAWSDRRANLNGHPINKTHATFLLMRKAENRLLSLDELYQLGKEEGYDLPKDDIGRVVSRQMARKLMEKVDGKYRQTPAGIAFNGFLPRKASVQG